MSSGRGSSRSRSRSRSRSQRLPAGCEWQFGSEWQFTPSPPAANVYQPGDRFRARTPPPPSSSSSAYQQPREWLRNPEKQRERDREAEAAATAAAAVRPIPTRDYASQLRATEARQREQEYQQRQQPRHILHEPSPSHSPPTTAASSSNPAPAAAAATAATSSSSTTPTATAAAGIPSTTATAASHTEALSSLLSALSSEKARNIALQRENADLASGESARVRQAEKDQREVQTVNQRLLDELNECTHHVTRLREERAESEAKAARYRQRALDYRARAKAAEVELVQVTDHAEEHARLAADELAHLRRRADERRSEVLTMFDALRGQFVDVLANWSRHIDQLADQDREKAQQLEDMRRRLDQHAEQMQRAKDDLQRIHESASASPLERRERADTESVLRQAHARLNLQVDATNAAASAAATAAASASSPAGPLHPHNTNDDHNSSPPSSSSRRRPAAAAATAAVATDSPLHRETAGSSSFSSRRSTDGASRSSGVDRPFTSEDEGDDDSFSRSSISRSRSPRATVRVLAQQAEREARKESPRACACHGCSCSADDATGSGVGGAPPASSVMCHHRRPAAEDGDRYVLYSAVRPVVDARARSRSREHSRPRPATAAATWTTSEAELRRSRARSVERIRAVRGRSRSRGGRVATAGGAARAEPGAGAGRSRPQSRSASAPRVRFGCASASSASSSSVCGRSRSRGRSSTRSPRPAPTSYPQFLTQAQYLHTRSSAQKIHGNNNDAAEAAAGRYGEDSSSEFTAASCPPSRLPSSFPERPCSGARRAPYQPPRDFLHYGEDRPSLGGGVSHHHRHPSPPPPVSACGGGGGGGGGGRDWTHACGSASHSSVQGASCVRPVYSYASTGDLLTSPLSSSRKKAATEGWRVPGLAPSAHLAGKGEPKHVDPPTPPQASVKAVYAKIAGIKTAGVRTKR